MTLLFVSFFSGILTVLAPCVLPLLPIIVGGSLAKGKARPYIIAGSLMLSVFLFTLLIKVSSILIGIPPIFFTYFSGGLVIGLGLISLFPQIWTRVAEFTGFESNTQKGLEKSGERKGFIGAILTGAALGPVFSSCSPTYSLILATILPVSLAKGIVYLIAYCAGLGLVLLLVSIFGQKLISRVKWAANPNGLFRRGLGVLFIIVGLLIITGYDKKIEQGVLDAGFLDITKFEQRILGNAMPNKKGSFGNSATPPVQPSTKAPESDAMMLTGSTLSGSTDSAAIQTGNSMTGSMTKPATPAMTNTGSTKPTESPVKTDAPPVVKTPVPTPTVTKPPFPLAYDGTVTAPELVGLTNWINSNPLTLASLRGKVVLIDFWTYSCINCQRTLPYLKEWDKKYRDDGLVIIGLHAPEFAFEKDPKNVAKAVADAGIRYPVALDNGYSTWNAYENQYWPAKYFIDREGKLRHSHFGEGEYKESEQVIQYLLGVGGPTSVVNPTASTGPRISPETYLGISRASSIVNDNYKDGVHDFIPVTPLTSNKVTLGGTWNVKGERIIGQNGSILTMKLSGKDIYLVVSGSTSGKIKVTLPEGLTNLSSEVKNGVINITGDKMYHVAKFSTLQKDILVTLETDSSMSLHAFTFGG